MEGLKTTRVVVLDNELDQAVPFMEALAKRGIGSLFFSGKAEDRSKLPDKEEKLTGIRLAAVDMNLTDQEGEADHIARNTVGVLNDLIDGGNGPYLAVAWTNKGSELVDAFIEQASGLICPPIKVVKMDKGDNNDPDTLFGNLQKVIDECYPLRLLSYWEQSIHDSSGMVTQVLQESETLTSSYNGPSLTSSDEETKAVSESETWNGRTMKILRMLLDAATNKDDESEAKLAALMSVLNALQLDAIETIITQRDDGPVESLISPLNDVSLSHNDNPLKATLNSRLLCTDPATGLVPGNIYRVDHFDESVRDLFPRLGRLTFDAADRGVEHNANLVLRDESVPIAMEVTPVCDYQQRKRGIPRFLCGLAIPIDKIYLLKGENALFMKKTEPMALDTPDMKGLMSLVWNSHFVVSVPEKMIEGATGFVRLRQAPLIDVQAWLGGQGNRPGYLSVQISSSPPGQSNPSPAPGTVPAE